VCLLGILSQLGQFPFILILNSFTRDFKLGAHLPKNCRKKKTPKNGGGGFFFLIYPFEINQNSFF